MTAAAVAELEAVDVMLDVDDNDNAGALLAEFIIGFDLASLDQMIKRKTSIEYFISDG